MYEIKTVDIYCYMMYGVISKGQCPSLYSNKEQCPSLYSNKELYFNKGQCPSLYSNIRMDIHFHSIEI